MKSFIVAAALVGMVAAQDLASLPACGQTCISNMLREAPNIECPPQADGQPDVACLCSSADFGYGVRDCTIQACPADTDTQAIIDFGLAYCSSVAGGSASGSGSVSDLAAPSALQAEGTASGAVGVGALGTAASGSDDAAETPYTTEEFASTITDANGSTSVVSGFRTLFTAASGSATDAAGSITGSAASAASAASESADSAVSSASDAASSVTDSAASAASSATDAAGDAASSATDAVGSATESAASAAGSATSSVAGGLAPIATVAAHGLAGMAGLAAVLLL